MDSLSLATTPGTILIIWTLATSQFLQFHNFTSCPCQYLRFPGNRKAAMPRIRITALQRESRRLRFIGWVRNLYSCDEIGKRERLPAKINGAAARIIAKKEAPDLEEADSDLECLQALEKA